MKNKKTNSGSSQLDKRKQTIQKIQGAGAGAAVVGGDTVGGGGPCGAEATGGPPIFNGVDVGGPVGSAAADCGMGCTAAGNDVAGTGCNGTGVPNGGWAVVNVSFEMGAILAVVAALIFF